MAIKRIGIISKPRKAEIREIVPELVEWLRERDIEVSIDKETGSILESSEKCLTRNELPGKVDLLVVLGGDGTLLAAARTLYRHDVPIFAVNLGDLGFLTVITRDELYPALEGVLSGDYRSERRVQIEGELVRADEVLSTFRALNDVVLNNRVRGVLDAAVSALRLGSHDRATRLKAARELADDPRAAALPIVARALKRETDPEIKGLLQIVAASVHLHAGSKAERLAAIRTLARSGNTKTDAAIDIDGGIGTLKYYARLGGTLADARFLIDDKPVRLAKAEDYQAIHLLAPRRGVAVHINAFNFPSWGLWEKAAVSLLAGVPAIEDGRRRVIGVLHV